MTRVAHQFAYEARMDDGRLSVGMITADSVDHAGQLLSERGLFVVRVAAPEGQMARGESHGRATRAELAWQMSQLSIMVRTGIHLSEALDCLARQASTPRLRALLESVSRSVHEGRALSDAMAMHPKSFPASLVALIRASELSGTMSLVLQKSSGYLLKELQTRKRLRAAIAYPLFMLAACIGVTVFLLMVILPRFAHIFASRGAILPMPTRLLMAMSQNLMDYWLLWTVAAATLTGAAWWWSRTALGRQNLDHLTLRLPVLSRVCHLLCQSRSVRILALLHEAGVPLIDTMRIIREIVPNMRYRELWQQVGDHICRGERLAVPLLNSKLIPEPVAQMIDAGDRSGKLGFVCGQLADFIEDEYDQALRSATQFIEPCMIVCMGVAIGFVAASLMLPLFRASLVMTN